MAILEYLFIDKDFNLEINYKYNQGSFYGCIEFRSSSEIKLSTLKNLIPKDVESSASKLKYFEDKKIDLNDYRFGILEESKIITEFKSIDKLFFQKLQSSRKFLIFGKEFDLDKFKENKAFTNFYNFVYSLNEADYGKNFENFIEPDATVEYLFIEKAEKQFKTINDDQGYIMAFINIFFTGEAKNDNLKEFRRLLSDELNYSVKDSKYFRNKVVNLNNYKFYLVDNYMETSEFILMDDAFFNNLLQSQRNLVIVGKNFDIDKFKQHELFHEWFNKYTNKF